jgi:hypothetical protein
MLGTDKSRGYCLEMIRADFLAGAHLDNGNSETLLNSISRYHKFSPGANSSRFSSKPCGPCPASSILSGQRQLDFPMLFERYQQQSGLWEKWESRGFCGISKGGGKGGKPAFGFPRFPRPGFFHSPSAAVFLLLEETSIVT